MVKLALAATLVALSSVLATASASSPTKLHVLVYETENDALGIDSPSQRLVDQINRDKIEGIHATVYGHNKRGSGFAGYGSKFSSVVPILEMISQSDDDTLVVLSDSRDVLLNNPFNDMTFSKDLVNEFRTAFDDVTALKPMAIVVSAEAQCCVSALTHVPLGGYYNTDGSRKDIACSSGSEGCLWAGDDKAEPWELFMNERMIEQSFGKKYDDAYLNAGLMVGKPMDLLRVILSAQISDNEDDQAVWTDYMYHNPNDIVLDYQQRLFGNNRGGIANIHDGGCVFKQQPDSKRLIHMMTQTQPLFLHSPGAFFACHDQMSQALGVPKVGATIRRKLRAHDKNRRTECNYGRLGSDCATDDSGSVIGGLVGWLGSGSVAKTVAPAAAPVSSLGGLLSRPDTSAPLTAGLTGFLTNTNSSNSSLAGFLTNPSSSNSSLSGFITNTSSSNSSLSGFLTYPSTTNSSLSSISSATPASGLSGFLTSTSSSNSSLSGVLTNTSTTNATSLTNSTANLGSWLTGTSAPVTNSTTNFGSLLSSGNNVGLGLGKVEAPVVAAPVAVAPTVFSFFNTNATTTTTTTSSAPLVGSSESSDKKDKKDGKTSLDTYLNTPTLAPAATEGSTSARTPAPAPVGTLIGQSRDEGTKPKSISK
jgi:hypothetical protein